MFIGRDSFGVRPVFKSFNPNTGTLSICSEAKGLITLKTNTSDQVKIEALLPGTIEEYKLIEPNNSCEFVKETKFHKIGFYFKKLIFYF